MRQRIVASREWVFGHKPPLHDATELRRQAVREAPAKAWEIAAVILFLASGEVS